GGAAAGAEAGLGNEGAAGEEDEVAVEVDARGGRLLDAGSARSAGIPGLANRDQAQIGDGAGPEVMREHRVGNAVAGRAAIHLVGDEAVADTQPGNIRAEQAILMLPF